MSPNLKSDNDDDFDIYGDLDGQTKNIDSKQNSLMLSTEYDSLNDEVLLYNELNSLDAEVKELRRDKKTLTEENVSLKASLSAKERQVLVLKNNISSLYKTAKLELDRRSNDLANLRREYDSLIFRRRTSQNKSEFDNESSGISLPNYSVPNKSMVNASTDTFDLTPRKSLVSLWLSVFCLFTKINNLFLGSIIV